MFASLVTLNQSFDTTQKDAVFNSSMHFVGFGRGAVVNSEIIQRLGTFFPQDKYANMFPDLQMTTIDPNDFEQNLNGRINNYFDPKVQIWENVTFADNYYQTATNSNPRGRDIVNLIPDELLPPDTKTYESRPDLSIHLGGENNPNSRVGFTLEDKNRNPHARTLSWYGGTVDLSWDKFNSLIHRRQGDFSYSDLYDPNFPDAQPWYQAYHAGNNVVPGSNPYPDPILDPPSPTIGIDTTLQTEGVGTGWYYSVLGNGYNKREQLPKVENVRTPLDFDNTSQARMRGDYTVPTLFNGNFDAISNIMVDQSIPGWSLHQESDISTTSIVNTQASLVNWTDISSLSQPKVIGWASKPSKDNPDGTPLIASYLQLLGIDKNDPNYKNYALKLTSNEELIHNRFVVPDWGTLRFDLHVPDARGGEINVWIKGEEPSSQWQRLSIFSNTKGVPGVEELFGVDLRSSEDPGRPYKDPYIDGDKINQLGRAKYYEVPAGKYSYFDVPGFETFHLNIPDELRGKIASLKFTLDGGTKEVYLDNIFFKSESLKFGNPTLNEQEARFDTHQADNYLIERPQYSVSYNNDKKIPNWVAWQLNRADLGPNSRTDAFRRDYTLPDSFGKQPNNPDYSGTRYDRGHLIASSHRLSSIKDNKETFLFTNMLPQSIDNNRFFRDGASAWTNLEKFESNKMVSELGYELYNFAGGIGNKFDDEQWDGEIASRATVNYREGEIEKKTQPGNLLKAGIDIPEWTWKIVLALQPGQGVEDVTVDTPIIAVMTPNIAEPERFYPPFGNPFQRVIHPLYPSRSINRDEWRNWQTWQVSIDMIEKETGLDFFSELPDEIEKALERKITNLSESDLRPITDFPLFPDLPDDEEEDNSSSDLSLQAPLLVEAQEAVNLPIIVGGIDNSPVLQSQLYSPTSKIDSLDIFSSSQIGTKGIGNSNFSIEQVSPSHISAIQLSPLQQGFGQISLTQVSISEIAFTQISTGQVGITQVGSFQIDPPQVSLSQIGTTEINPTQIGSDSLTVGFGIRINVKVTTDSTKISSFEIDPAKISLPSSVTSQQLFTIHNSPFALINTYKDSSINLFDPTFNITLQIADLPTGQLAEAQITNYDTLGRPNGGTILIDTDANGIGWFIDPTPWENSEFSSSLTDTAFRATTGEAFGKYDLLTTILHETGHLLGIINGNPGFDSYVQSINGTKTFIGDNFTATLTPDGSHLDSKVHPYDLMNNTLAPGVRKLPSWLNLQMLNAIRNTTVASNSATQLTAPLKAILLADITNGSFNFTDTSKPEYGWSTRGAATILNSQAVLTEDSPLLSNFSQSFIIPEGAKYLQFTLKNTTLGANTPQGKRILIESDGE